MINLIKNRDDLKKWLLATSDYGHEIPEKLNAIAGHDEKFNNAIVRHALDLKDEADFRNPNPLNVTFYDMKKFDQVNPTIRKLAAQVKASKFYDYEVTKKLIQQGEIKQLENRLNNLGKEDDDEDNNRKPGGGRGSGGTPGPPRPPKTPQQEMDEITKRLDLLRGNTVDVSPNNTPEENSRIIAQENNEKFVNQQLNQRKTELSRLPKGNINGKGSSLRSSIHFKLPDTPPFTPETDYWTDVADNLLSTPAPTTSPPAPPAPMPLSGPPEKEPSLFNYNRNFPPLSREVLKKNLPPITPSIETSFLSPEGSFSPLRNKLPLIAPLHSRPNINNFSKPITEITDEKNNTISITQKNPVLPPIGQKRLSEELGKIFPDVDETIKEKANTFEE